MAAAKAVSLPVLRFASGPAAGRCRRKRSKRRWPGLNRLAAWRSRSRRPLRSAINRADTPHRLWVFAQLLPGEDPYYIGAPPVDLTFQGQAGGACAALKPRRASRPPLPAGWAIPKSESLARLICRQRSAKTDGSWVVGWNYSSCRTGSQRGRRRGSRRFPLRGSCPWNNPHASDRSPHRR